MRKIDLIKNLADSKNPKATEGLFESGYVKGVEGVKQDIKEILENESFENFLENIGGDLWDSAEVRLILKKKTVFIIKENYHIELDEINLIEEDVFTKNIDKYEVEDYLEIDGINYIFLKENEK